MADRDAAARAAILARLATSREELRNILDPPRTEPNGDGGATACCQPHDFRSVLTPGKMIGPFLPSRVPQPDALSRDGIPSLGARCLELVTRMASEPEVVFSGLASFRFGNDMLDAQTKTRDALGRTTITTPIASSPGHVLAQVARHMRLAGHC